MDDEEFDLGLNNKKDLTEDLLEQSFQSVRISSSTDGSLAQEIKKSFVNRLAPWLLEQTKLLPHEEAAMLLEYASEGLELLKIELTHRARTCYHLRRKYHLVYRLAAWSILLIHIFELPVWTYRVSYENWSDGAKYPSFQLPYLPLLASTLLYMLCYAFLWFAVFLELGYRQNTKHWPFTAAFAALLTLQTMSVFMQLIYAIIGSSIMISCAPFAAFNVLLVEFRFQHHLAYLLRTLPRFAVLTICLAIMIILYTSFAFYFFEPGSAEAEQYFPDFGTGLWNMLMVFVASNWPSPMIPAFHQNRLYCIYFYFYIIAFNWGLLNLLLGFVYLFIKVEQNLISERYNIIRRLYLQTAFQVLDHDEKGFLSYTQVDALIEEVYRYYMQTLNPPTSEERYELLLELDGDGSGVITLKDFENIEEKCFENSLKLLRAKKVRFHRFFSTATATSDAALVRKNTNTFPETRGSSYSHHSFSTSNILRNLHSEHFVPAAATAQQGMTGEEQRGDGITALDEHIGDSYYSQRPGGDKNERLLSEASNYGKISNQHLAARLRSVEIMDRLANATNNPLQTDQPDSSNSFLQSLTLSITRCLRYGKFKLSTIAMHVDSVNFDIAFDVFLCILAILCFACSDDVSWPVFVLYLAISSFECVCKLLVKGRFRYIKSSRNFVDGIITIALLAIVIGQAAGKTHDGANTETFNNNFGLESLVLLRLLLFPRNIIALKSFDSFRRRHRTALMYAFQSAGHILFLSITMAALLYAYAALGQQLFGGSIVKTGDTGAKISASDYGQSAYWPLNFNDMLSSLVTMFVLLHVNNTHVIASGFVAGTTTWAEVFFAIWYVVGVLLLLNVLVAVFVNRFAGYLEVLAIEQNKQQLQQNEKEERMRLLSSSKDSPVPTPNTSGKFAQTTTAAALIDHTDASMKRTAPASPAGEVISASNNGLRRASSLTGLAAKANAAATGSSYLDQVHGGGFEESIFADTSYRASLLQMMKSVTMATSFSLRPSTFAPAPGTSSVNGTSDHLRGALRKSVSESAALHAPSRHSMVFVAANRNNNATDKGEDPEADLEITPEAEEEIVINVELKIQNLADGTFNDPSEESVKRALLTVEKDLKRGSPSPHVSQKPTRLTTFKESKPANTSGQSSLNSSAWAQSLPPHSENSDIRGSQSIAETRAGTFLYLFYRMMGWKKTVGENSRGQGDNEDEEELTRFEKAAVLIQFAREGEGEQVIAFTRFSFTCYKLHNRHIRLFQLAAFLLLVLRFFERPMWTYSQSSWSDNSIYPRFGIPLISAQLTCAFKIPLFLILLVGLLLELGYKEVSPSNFLAALKRRFIADQPAADGVTASAVISRSRICRVLLTIHMIIMIFILFIVILSNFRNGALVTATSFGSVVYFLWFNRRTLQKAQIISKILPKFFIVVFLLAIVVMVFAGFGPLIFDLEQHSDDDYKANSSNDDDATIYFGTFPNSIWSIFVAITSSSFPNQVIPAYQTYREVCIYFIAFVTIGAFGLLNVIIVLVFIEFQKSLQSTYDRQKIFRDILLFKAFQTLDVENRGYLLFDEVQEVCEEMYTNYSNFRKIGFSQSLTRRLLIEILDIDGDGKISLSDFLFFLDVMRIKLKLYKKYDIAEHYKHYLTRNTYTTSLSASMSQRYTQGDADRESWTMQCSHIIFRYVPLSWLIWFDRRLIATRWLDLIADTIGLFFFALNIFVNGLDGLYDPTRSFVLFIILTLLTYACESSLKIFFRGSADYFRSYRNRFDFGMTLVLFFSIIIDAAINLLYQNDFFTFFCKVAYLLRIFLFPRNIRIFLRGNGDVRKIAKLLRRIFSKLYTLTMVFVCVAYSYANLGCFLYGGLIDKQSTNQHFMNSQFVENDFWALNFNDMMSSVSTLFVLLHVSDFDVIGTGFTTSTTPWSRIFFGLWYVIGVLFLLNVLKSFFLGEFLSLFVNPLDNLPSLGYNKNDKAKKKQNKRSSKRKSDKSKKNEKIEKDEDEDEKEKEDDRDFSSMMLKNRETQWISRQRLMNQGLRNRLIERLNRSLLQTNRQELADRESNTSSQRDIIRDEDSFRTDSIGEKDDVDLDDVVNSPSANGSLSYRDYKAAMENRPARKSLPMTTATNPLLQRASASSLPFPKAVPSSDAVEPYQPPLPVLHEQRETSVSSAPSSLFREIDETTATTTTTHTEEIPIPSASDTANAPFDGSTMIVSSLKLKGLDSEGEEALLQRLREVSLNLGMASNPPHQT